MTLATKIKWLVGMGVNADGTVDRYGIKDGEFQLLKSIPPQVAQPPKREGTP
jgi:hypothetical protein